MKKPNFEEVLDKGQPLLIVLYALFMFFIWLPVAVIMELVKLAK